MPGFWQAAACGSVKVVNCAAGLVRRRGSYRTPTCRRRYACIGRPHRRTAPTSSGHAQRTPGREHALGGGREVAAQAAAERVEAGPEYVWDGRGRRVGKKKNGVLVQQLLYKDQLKPVAELDGAGNLVARYVYGSKANVPDLVLREGKTYRVVSDQLGSPVLAVNVADSTDVAMNVGYSAFGEATGTGVGWMALGFAGGLYDAETGLVRFGARDYDASTGRWVSKDPIGFQGGDTGLFGYVGNAPTNNVDSSGTVGVACVAAIAACVGYAAYSATQTVLDYLDCMSGLEVKPQPTDFDEICQESPEEQIVKGAKKCIQKLGTAAVDNIRDDVICGVVVAAACRLPF